LSRSFTTISVSFLFFRERASFCLIPFFTSCLISLTVQSCFAGTSTSSQPYSSRYQVYYGT
jgi:hypothetical protein